MIYAIKAVGTEYIKFGYTSDESVKGRLDALQTGCPHELKAVAFGPGERSLEGRIHWRLKKAGEHHRGEWFRCSPEAVKIIWEIRYSAEPQQLPSQAVADQPQVFAKTQGRLGRVLEYAKRFASDHPSSQLAGTAQALQPDPGAA